MKNKQVLGSDLNKPFRYRYSAVLLILVVTGFSCVTQQSSKPYAEDLSANRPKFVNVEDTVKKNSGPAVIPVSVTPTKNVNAKVDEVLDSIDRFNLTKRFVDGFTIQVYSGQNREDAMKAKQKVITDAYNLVANLQYVQPKFKVTIGNYFTKLEAQKDFMRLKRIFPNAILLPEKVLIR